MKDSINVLLVEDDEVEVLKVKRAFEKNNFHNRIVVAEDGIVALRLLREKLFGQNVPSLILLDLNMPRMNGIEFLREIRSDSMLKDRVVVVLTTSRDERDVAAAFQWNVAGYIVKPIGFQEFVNAVAAIQHYWQLSEWPSNKWNNK